jgi:hypothetical protein
MDWAAVIHRNRTALIPIIDALFALLGLATRLSPSVHRHILRSLRPAESAVRRLIVMAARGLVVKSGPARSKPVGPIAAGTGAQVLKRLPSFRLFDAWRGFGGRRRRKISRVVPRIRVLDCGYDPRISAQFPPPRPPAPPPVPAPVSDGLVDASPITRRLQALESALDDLPRQARRLARWQQKRETLPRLRYRAPMRPGPPPGHRSKKCDLVHQILAECHDLAWQAMALDTS